MQIIVPLRMLGFDRFFVLHVLLVRISSWNLEEITIRLQMHETQPNTNESCRIHTTLDTKEDSTQRREVGETSDVQIDCEEYHEPTRRCKRYLEEH